jgi:hypothetical protein
VSRRAFRGQVAKPARLKRAGNIRRANNPGPILLLTDLHGKAVSAVAKLKQPQGASAKRARVMVMLSVPPAASARSTSD